jgi:hypothetical protein
LVALATVSASAGAGVVVEVTLPTTPDRPLDGRLVVFAIREGAPLSPDASPIDGPFWDAPQPMWGVDVRGVPPGGTVRVGDEATSFGYRLSELPAGQYRFQALLDRHRLDSDWRREPGNFYSDVVEAVVPEGGEGEVRLVLSRRVGVQPTGLPPGFEEFRVRSALLSAFAGRNVDLVASVSAPATVKAGRRYAAIYLIPGFGGTHAEVSEAGRIRSLRTLAESVFVITLNPESPNGHTLFADSDCNGPWGAALVRELLPALEREYPLAGRPEARLLRGHSSGGWSAVWLAVTYPEVFGGAWASAPDPLDFRAFQRADIYAGGNMYGPAAERPEVTALEPLPGDEPSYRRDGRALMTVAQENAMEEVLGPGNTSGQQWDSWQAVFGPRAAGWPATGVSPGAALFDARTGVIDAEVAAHYARFDIGRLLREDPARFGPIFKQRIRVLCGGEDDFYLERAVGLVKEEVDRLQFLVLPEGDHGYMRIVPGRDHGSVLATPEAAAMYAQMLDHLRRHGLAADR